jgi:hypothetical protein
MANTGSRTYGNVVVKWTASTTGSALSVAITAGGVQIAQLSFTPDTLNQYLNYQNPPQFSSGKFLVTFDASGQSGQLSCENFIWNIDGQSGGPVNGFIGTWSLS